MSADNNNNKNTKSYKETIKEKAQINIPKFFIGWIVFLLIFVLKLLTLFDNSCFIVCGFNFINFWISGGICLNNSLNCSIEPTLLNVCSSIIFA